MTHLPPARPLPGKDGRVPVLDGVRAMSILAVLAAHLFPVRFGATPLNASLGILGMALFFVLSGYLITGQLLQRPSLRSFAARRMSRILPAAWLCLAVVWLVWPIDSHTMLANLLFYANLPPSHLVPPIEHYWSLCVEVQFYVLAMGLLLLRPALVCWLLPALLLSLTALRLSHEVTASSVTWFRADDIVAGATLAVALHSRLAPPVMRWVGARPSIGWLLLTAFVASCILPKTGSHWLNYLRPYFAAALVGTLMSQPTGLLSTWLSHRALGYVASISYALYIWHLPLAATWLGSGDLLEKYLKRPLLLLVLFAVAHASTHYFERRFIEWGKRLGRSRSSRESIA